MPRILLSARWPAMDQTKKKTRCSTYATVAVWLLWVPQAFWAFRVFWPFWVLGPPRWDPKGKARKPIKPRKPKKPRKPIRPTKSGALPGAPNKETCQPRGEPESGPRRPGSRSCGFRGVSGPYGFSGLFGLFGFFGLSGLSGLRNGIPGGGRAYIYTSSPMQLVEMLIADRFLPMKTGGKCSTCGHGVLGPLQNHASRGPCYRCSYKHCRKFELPHAGHPIFKLGNNHITSLKDQAALLLCLVFNSTRVLAHQLTGLGHKVIESLAAALDDCRCRHVMAVEPTITFGNADVESSEWRDVEADEVDLRSSFTDASLTGETMPEVVWEQWCGMVERGRPGSLVLDRLAAPNTSPRSPGAGPIRARDWQPIARRLFVNRHVVLHTDGARAYKLKVPGMLHDHVIHKKKKMKTRDGRLVRRDGKPVWIKPRYTNIFHHKIANGKTLTVVGGTQIIDRAWAFLRDRLRHKYGKPRSEQVQKYVRAAQWCYWNRDEDLWIKTGEMLEALRSMDSHIPA